jgi:hypothetical protein
MEIAVTTKPGILRFCRQWTSSKLAKSPSAASAPAGKGCHSCAVLEIKRSRKHPLKKKKKKQEQENNREFQARNNNGEGANKARQLVHGAGGCPATKKIIET